MSSVADTLLRERRYLRQTYLLAVGCAILLAAFGGYCWFIPNHGTVSVFARVGSLVLLVVSLCINISNIVRTRKFLRMFE